MIYIQVIRSDTHDLSVICLEMQAEKWGALDGSYSIKGIKSFVSNSDNYFLVAFIDEQVVGALTAYKLQRMDSRNADMFIDEVETKKEFRRQGVARAMLLEIYKIAKEQDCGELWVAAESDNNPAIELYSSLKLEIKVEDARVYTYKIV